MVFIMGYLTIAVQPLDSGLYSDKSLKNIKDSQTYVGKMFLIVCKPVKTANPLEKQPSQISMWITVSIRWGLAQNCVSFKNPLVLMSLGNDLARTEQRHHTHAEALEVWDQSAEPWKWTDRTRRIHTELCVMAPRKPQHPAPSALFFLKFVFIFLHKTRRKCPAIQKSEGQKATKEHFFQKMSKQKRKHWWFNYLSQQKPRAKNTASLPLVYMWAGLVLCKE